MRAVASVCVVSGLLAGCAGPTGLQLRADTEEMGPSFGYLQQRQILENVSRMIDNPWAMPGHIEVSSGNLQVQDQATFAWTLPFTGLMGHGLREVDPSLQSQEQHSFIISPVTDGDDLRRLHAVYRYAICNDTGLFRSEWNAIIRPYARAAGVAQSAARVAQSKDPQVAAQTALLRAQREYERDLAEITKLRQRIAELRSKKELTPQESDELKNDETRETQSSAQLEPLYKEWQQLLENYQKYSNQQGLAQIMKKGGGGGGGGGSGSGGGGGQSQSQDQGGGGQGDTIEVETFKGEMIEQILGDGPRWLYWRPVDGTIHYPCPPARPEPTPSFDVSDGWHNMGVYGRYELWTNNPEKMSQFMMLANGSIPNTSGVHTLGSVLTGSTGSNSPSKASSTPYIRLIQ